MTRPNSVTSLTVPADARYAGVLRVAVFEFVSVVSDPGIAADVAAATGEAFILVDLGAPGATATVRVEASADGVEVSVSGPSGGLPDDDIVDARAFAGAILTSLVDQHEVVVTAGSVITTLSKSFSDAPAPESSTR